jgi:hypothetical protein
MLLPISRIADRPYYSGKHKRHGRDVQVTFGRCVGLAGTAQAFHDVRAAREDGIIDALDHHTSHAGRTRATKAPARHDPGPPPRPMGGSLHRQQATNPSQAKIRALVEQAMATLKSWRLLCRLHCSTNRITSLDQAVLPRITPAQPQGDKASMSAIMRGFVGDGSRG